MRAAVLLSVLLFPAAAAAAQPGLPPPPDGFADTGPNRPALSLSPRQLFNGMRHDRENPLLLSRGPAEATDTLPAISLAPATFDPHALPSGRRKQHLSPRYRIGIAKLFGGSLGGSIGTRSASLSLSWQTDR
jgi:hypothetical protein